jgi:hypothetical protein
VLDTEPDLISELRDSAHKLLRAFNAYALELFLIDYDLPLDTTASLALVASAVAMISGGGPCSLSLTVRSNAATLQLFKEAQGSPLLAPPCFPKSCALTAAAVAAAQSCMTPTVM